MPNAIPIALSAVRAAIRREAPRPPHLRNEAYEDQFDWDTLVYDVYRAGPHIVFQGPPLANFWTHLASTEPLRRPGWLWPRYRRIERLKASEIWLRSDADQLSLTGPLGAHEITVQPDMADMFAGRRVLHTLSKNNDINWIIDWLRFYVRVHGADGLLLYDNASTDYTVAELDAALRQAFPDIAIAVVLWPFRYGPQGGLAGAVDGIETPWDSDFCQTGSLQHARHRFLRGARAVLNVDIDELVLSTKGRSIFAATHDSRAGFIKFAGHWISTATPQPIAQGQGRHGDFIYRDTQEHEECPPKWCIVPARHRLAGTSWSVHNLFGARANKTLDREFSYAHVKGISNSWKYNRWDAAAFDPARFIEDTALAVALAQCGLRQG